MSAGEAAAAAPLTAGGSGVENAQSSDRITSLVFFQNARPDRPQAKEVAEALTHFASVNGLRVEHILPYRGETLSAAARRAGDRAVADGGALVAVGGDGTVNLVVHAAMALGCPIGIVPRGTFNFVAREFGIPETLPEALDLLAHARPHPVQVGQANDHYFLVNASIGLYRRVLAEREWFKRSLGRRRYVAGIAAIYSALHQCPVFQFRMDGTDLHEHVRAATVVVGNNRLQLSLAGFEEQLGDVGRGELMSARLAATSRWRRLSALVRGAMGALPSMPEIATRRIREMRLDMPRRRRRVVGSALDGEVAHLTLPITFRALPGALQLIRPDPTDP